MWESLKAYKLLDKKDINPSFRKFGKAILSFLDEYEIEQTNSTIKIARVRNNLEQAIFIEKGAGSYSLKVITCVKPVDFYRKHKFTKVNIVPLGDILNNYRRTSYPLTKEWNDLALFLATKIKDEVEKYFQRFDSYEKIIEKRSEMETPDFNFENKCELLINASIRTRNKALLNLYLDQKIRMPGTKIGLNEFLKPHKGEIREDEFLQLIKPLALIGDFESIEKEID